jgi:hypothetical protein
MSFRTSAGAGALTIALLAPTAAEAATIAPLKPCYVTAGTAANPQREGVAINASGFTPNSTVTMTLDGATVPRLQTDPAGNLTLPQEQVPAPFIAKGSREFSITLVEDGNPANTVTATTRTTALGVSVKPRRAKPSQRIRFKGSGFTERKAVYAHYIYKGKLRKTVRLARKTSKCGGWKVKRPQIPVDDPGTGMWRVQFDQSKRYRDARDPNSGLQGKWVLLRISVTRVPAD